MDFHIYDHLLQLTRISLGSKESFPFNGNIDWGEMMDMAILQGLDALSFDGLQTIYDHLSKEEACVLDASIGERRYDWMGLALQAEQNYEAYYEKLRSLATFYRENGIRVLVLKGYGLSLDYPTPPHRTMGDIDLYLFGRGKDADEMVKAKWKISVKQNEDKHSVFSYRGLSVENHASFINVVEHPSLKEIEVFLESSALNAPSINMDGVEINVPSPTMNAVFLPCHMAAHFVFGGMQLKQLTDWAVFIMNKGKDVDWSVARRLAEHAGCFAFFKVLNGIIIEHFGVPSELLPNWGRDLKLEKRIWLDTLNHKAAQTKRTVLMKIHDYFIARWKFKLVYRESLFFNFIQHSWASFRIKYLPNSRSVWDR